MFKNILCFLLNKIYKIFKFVVFVFDSEILHNIAIYLLKNNFVPSAKLKQSQEDSLNIKFFNYIAKNPIGLAAGFDKNAECLRNLSKIGFGFIEVGTSTPLPQYGNSKPRLFRLKKYKSIVNRFGFNNKGSDYFVNNLKNFYLNPLRDKKVLIGANIGKNKDTQDISSDYITMIKKVYEYCDYITINISSPNTKGLRDIQNEKNLEILLQDIDSIKNDLIKKTNNITPILLKISPDISNEQVVQIINLVGIYKIDGLILTNTTVQKKFQKNQDEISIDIEGGISGNLLKDRSFEILKLFNTEIKKQNKNIPIISVGGISSSQDISDRLNNGAFAVQIYSSLIYEGFYLIHSLKKDLKSYKN